MDSVENGSQLGLLFVIAGMRIDSLQAIYFLKVPPELGLEKNRLMIWRTDIFYRESMSESERASEHKSERASVFVRPWCDSDYYWLYLGEAGKRTLEIENKHLSEIIRSKSIHQHPY